MAKAMHKNAKPKAFQVKPVKAALLAAIVLEKLLSLGAWPRPQLLVVLFQEKN